MTEWDNDEDFQNEHESDGPLPVREALKAEKRRNKEMEDRLNALSSQLTQLTVKETVRDLGFNPALVEKVPPGLDAEGAKSWLTEMSSLFGGATAPEAKGTVPTGQNSDSDQDAAADEALNRLEGGTNAGSYSPSYADVPEGDVQALWAATGAKVREELGG